MALKVNLINEQAFYRLPMRQLENMSEFILRSQGIKNTEVNILFTGDKIIRQFNKRFRRKDKATDVLSFYEESNKEKAVKSSYLGEIVISVETARRQAKIYNQSVISEIRLYVIHGLLHLLGYRDYTPEEKKVMNKLQQALLRQYEKKNNS